MPTKDVFNPETGETETVEMTGAELAAHLVTATPLPPPTARWQQVAAEGETANATPATLAAWPLALRTLYTARFTLFAINTGNGDCRVWHATATAKRVNGGALMVGAPTVLSSHADAGAAAWAVAAEANGNEFRVRVTGAAGQTIKWVLLGEVLRARPDGLVD